MDIKAIFFDIDGTLVSFETHAIPQSTLEAITVLRQKGIKLIIATGRALVDINNLGDLQFDGYIAANGAYCTESNKKDVVFKNLIPKDNLLRLVESQKHDPFSCVFMTDKGNFANYIDEGVIALNKMVNLPLPPVKPIEEVIEYDVFQIDGFISAEKEASILANVLVDCEGSRWHPDFVDINVKGNTKSTGIDVFLKKLDISIENTMAFGDGGNDISMLRHAGIGVAMGNASDRVKAAADYVTSSVDENGIVNALKYFGVI